MVGAGMTHEVIIIRTGADTFDVIVGHRLNDRPLSWAEAQSPGPRQKALSRERRKVGWPSTTTSPARKSTLPRMGRLVRASTLVLMQKAIFAEMKSKNNRE
jgi:hypothetical protein